MARFSVVSARLGDLEALDVVIEGFEEFYRDLHPRLVSALVVVAGDAELGREAADEAAARALADWSRVAGMDNAAGWVFRVGVNELRRTARRSAIEARLLRRSEGRVQDLTGPTGEIWQVVASLSSRQREAVVLRHLGQLTEPEIADAMGVTRGTVSSTLRAAYGRLRVQMGYEEQERDSHDRRVRP